MRSRAALALVALVALVVASCASDGSDSAGGAGNIPGATPAPVSTVDRSTVSTPPPESVTDSTDASPETTLDDPSSTDAAPTSPTPTTAAATTTTTTVPPDPPPPSETFVGLKLGVEQVVDVAHPTAVAWLDGDPAMYVSTQHGFVYRVDGERLDVVIDISGLTVEFAPGSERGLLGLAFDPRDGRMFLNYTDLDNNTNVVSFAVSDGIADLASLRQVLFIEQPGVGHNGGRLLFDDEGHLFIGSGDGGGSNGRDAQDTTKLLGAILRIIPNLDGDGYEIPADNPFADGELDRPEVWARGFRNPWTFSLDDETGDLWIGDVGNETREEIDVMIGGTSGLNFGWYWFEGTDVRRSGAPEGMTPPVFDYGRSEGVAVMGGYVYRGSEIPALRGVYLFGDLGGPVWGIGSDGVVRLDAERVTGLVGWGEDPDGELYMLGLNDGVFKLVER